MIIIYDEYFMQEITKGKKFAPKLVKKQIPQGLNDKDQFTKYSDNNGWDVVKVYLTGRVFPAFHFFVSFRRFPNRCARCLTGQIGSFSCDTSCSVR